MKNQVARNILMVGVVIGLALIAFILLARTNGGNIVGPLPAVTLKPLAAWTDDLVLKFGEPPSGWRFAGQTSYDEVGMPSHYYWFKNPPAERAGATLSEEFIVYSTTVLAEQAYPRILNEFFPPAHADAWKVVPELAIQHHADEMKIACLPGAQFNGSPNMGCDAIARYQNVIVHTIGNVLPNQWLTLSDFRQMLEAVDRHVAIVLSR